MKINWGIRAAILFGSFVIFILSMAFYASTQNFDLVTEDYYEKEVYHDTLMQKKKAFEEIGDEISYSFNDSNMMVEFPNYFEGETISGKMYMYRPSDERMDKHYDIDLESELMFTVPLSDLSKGVYEIQVDWESLDVAYFSTKRISI